MLFGPIALLTKPCRDVSFPTPFRQALSLASWVRAPHCLGY